MLDDWSDSGLFSSCSSSGLVFFSTDRLVVKHNRILLLLLSVDITVLRRSRSRIGCEGSARTRSAAGYRSIEWHREMCSVDDGAFDRWRTRAGLNVADHGGEISVQHPTAILMSCCPWLAEYLQGWMPLITKSQILAGAVPRTRWCATLAIDLSLVVVSFEPDLLL